jgi:hypothetical protein
VEATPPDAMSRREEGAVPVDAASGREVQAASTDATPRREEGPGPVDAAAARCFTAAAAQVAVVTSGMPPMPLMP